MTKRDEFVTLINTLKSLSSVITSEQRKSLLQQAVQQYGLQVDEATDILNTSGLTIGEEVDYFQVLGLSISDFENRSDLEIVHLVETAHKKLYSASLTAGGRPRADGRTEAQWRILLNQARDTLKDQEKRQTYLSTISEESRSIENQTDPPNLADMALVPAGEFQMGSNDEDAFGDEHPMHTVYLDAFYIDKYPVTNAQFKDFIDENPQWNKLNIPEKYSDVDYLKHWRATTFKLTFAEHPVVNVSWHAAMAYAQWKGKRLPTEAEWEKAARGGVTGQRFAWGNAPDPSMANYDWNVGETTPVGKYPPNGYDLYDMCGNVWEWCLDAYEEGFTMGSLPRNPIYGANTIEWVVKHFTDVESNRVLRGGSWRIPASFVRIANRNAESPSFSLNVIGFRCVWGVPTDNEANTQSQGLQPDSTIFL